MLNDIFEDVRLFPVLSEEYHAVIFDDGIVGRRIEHDLIACMTFEVGDVIGDILGNGPGNVTIFNNKRYPFCPDDMLWGQDASCGKALQSWLGGIGESQGALVYLHNDFMVFGFFYQRFEFIGVECRFRFIGIIRKCGPPVQKILGNSDRFYHLFVRPFGIIIEGKDTVVMQDDPFALFPVEILCHGVDGMCQDEAGHDIGDDEVVGEKFRNERFTLFGVGDGHHSIGMGMVHELKGDQRMQNGFHRRVRCFRVCHGGFLSRDHVGIAQGFELYHFQQGGESDRCKPFCFDGNQVPAASLDIKDILAVLPDLDGGVASAMQYQFITLPQQVGSIDSESQVIVAGSRLGIIP